MTIAPQDLKAAYAGGRAVITGGLGLIGSALAHRLIGLGAAVTIADSLDTQSSANFHNIASIHNRVRVERMDVRDTAALRPLIGGSDYLFNLAGRSSHTASMTEPLEDLDVNARAQIGILEACRESNPDISVVFASTRQIYGRPEYLPVDEHHRIAPRDINGVNKAAGEMFHAIYHSSYGIKTCALRLTNTYGPGMRIKDARQGFVGIWLRQIIERQPFEIWGGNQKRDFTYVDDAAEAFLRAAICSGLHGRAVNVGGNQALSLKDLAALLIAVNGAGEFTIRDFPEDRKPIDIGDYYADDTAFRVATGWRPTVAIEHGLTRTLAFFRENIDHYV